MAREVDLESILTSIDREERIRGTLATPAGVALNLVASVATAYVGIKTGVVVYRTVVNALTPKS